MSRLRWLYVLVFHNSVFLVCIAATLFQPLSVLAYDLNASVVTEDKGIFHIKISAIIEAPAEQIRQALSDYTHIYRLSPSIIESEVLPSSKKGEKKLKQNYCFAILCFAEKLKGLILFAPCLLVTYKLKLFLNLVISNPAWLNGKSYLWVIEADLFLKLISNPIFISHHSSALFS